MLSLAINAFAQPDVEKTFEPKYLQGERGGRGTIFVAKIVRGSVCERWAEENTTRRWRHRGVFGGDVEDSVERRPTSRCLGKVCMIEGKHVAAKLLADGPVYVHRSGTDQDGLPDASAVSDRSGRHPA